MAGRGRGRGSGTSLTQEQIQALGITRGDNTPQILAPPPLFPKLETKPLPLVSDAATDYMVIVKDQFIEYLQESPAFVKINTRRDGIERYSDKYKLLALNAKKGRVLDCVWANMPPELRPQVGRLRTITRKRKLEDPAEIAKRLQTLESKEKQETSIDENMETDENETNVKKEGEDNDEDLEDEQEQEEEIDDGTDYANNYFDNGEDYEEEDDNLDDGPVY